MKGAQLKWLSYKTALLLVLTSVKRVGDLTALSVNPALSVNQFVVGDSKENYQAASSPPESPHGEVWMATLCPVRAL